MTKQTFVNLLNEKYAVEYDKKYAENPVRKRFAIQKNSYNNQGEVIYLYDRSLSHKRYWTKYVYTARKFYTKEEAEGVLASKNLRAHVVELGDDICA